MIDSTDRERLSIIKEELWKMLSHDDLRKAGLLIYANKQDVKGCMTPAQISKELNLTAIKKHKWQIQACCALTGEGYQSIYYLFIYLFLQFLITAHLPKNYLNIFSNYLSHFLIHQ